MGRVFLIFNYIFGMFTIIIVLNYGENFKKEDWLKIIKTVSTIMGILVIGRFLINFRIILNFLSIY